MKRLSPKLPAVRAILAEHFELFLTSVGVLFATMIIVSELSRGQQSMALLFLIWLQGFILWAVHRHCVLRNRALISRLRLMLQDRVNNRLTVWLSRTDVQLPPGIGREEREAVSLAAARAVSLELEKLSLDSLRTWERRQGRFISTQLL